MGQLMSWVDLLKAIPQFAGVLALAAFAGTMLAGIVLLLFTKYFGPWKMLTEAREACDNCNRDRIKDQQERADMTALYERKIAMVQAELADFKTRQEILTEAIRRGGLGLKLVPNFTEIPPNI